MIPAFAKTAASPRPVASDAAPIAFEVHALGALPSTWRDRWRSLRAAQPAAGFEHHPDWYRAIDAHLLPGRLRVACARDARGAIALLPFDAGPAAAASGAADGGGDDRGAGAGTAARAGGGLRARLDGRALRHPHHPHLPLSDVLLHPALDPAETRALVGRLIAAAAPHSVLWRIADLPADSVLGGALGAETAAPEGWSRRPSRASARFALDGDACHPPGKLRRNLARLRRRLATRGALRVETVTGADGAPTAARLEAAFERFLAVEASGWKGEEGTAIARDPALTGFYRALLAPREPGLAARIDLLWLDEECVAAQYALVTDRRLSLLKIGYDERHADCSPGSLLLESTLEHARAAGLATLSLVTSPPWAARWHPEERALWHVVRYVDSMEGRARRVLDRLGHSARRRLRGDAGRAGSRQDDTS